MRRPIYETKRLILRPLRNSDYEAWYLSNAKCGPKKSKWDSGPRNPKSCSKRRFNTIRRRHQTLSRKDEYYFWGAFEKKSGRLVGHIDFSIFVRSTHQFANFGYYLHNPYYGRGFGQEGATMALRIGFRHLKLNRLEAAINFDNRKSIRLARAIGMRREGIKRRYWFEHGKWVDHIIYVANPEDVGLRPTKPF
jgi:[ribosomal protein S5]-alanine N-acetyltransferase